MDGVRPKPAVLLILDGWGIGPQNAGNAIDLANTPNMDRFRVQYPNTQVEASGSAVGLPKGEDGNTETGHLNIGAGRIVYQDLPRINMSIADGSFSRNPAFLHAIEHMKQHNSKLHLMGLVGTGGVHSNIAHLYALLEMAKQAGLTDQVYVHAFTDGRDSPPTSGVEVLSQLNEHLHSNGVGRLASVMGRYYAMDRDKRWERTQIAYDALTLGSKICTDDLLGTMRSSYEQGKTDEFIEPLGICEAGQSPITVQDNDAVVFFNFRIDRPRQLARAFAMENFETGEIKEDFDPYAVKYQKSHLKPIPTGPTFARQKILQNLYFVTMTEYERGLPVVVAYPPELVAMPLGRVFAEKSLRQLRMCETEKERFVTFYMNGQREELFPLEERVILPSKRVPTYDTVPEMSAGEITETLLQKLGTGAYDVAIVNYANADMVGHTGNLQATIKAVEYLDDCVGRVVRFVTERGGVVFITADHGNAEEMINNETGEVDTEHSTYPVPFFICSKELQMKSNKQMPRGILADIAPTMLKIMNISRPSEMTGRELL